MDDFRCGAPSGARFSRVKVPNPPGSGKDIAEGKGVHREVESEGSWMWGKILTSWANLWSDEQKSHIRLCMRVRLPLKSKPNNYTESCMINEADRWRGRNVWYQSHRMAWEVCAASSERSNHRPKRC